MHETGLADTRFTASEIRMPTTRDRGRVNRNLA